MRASNAQKSLALRGGSPRPKNALLQQKNGDFALRVLPGVVSIKTPPFAEVGSRPALRRALNASGCREKGEHSSLLSKGEKGPRRLSGSGMRVVGGGPVTTPIHPKSSLSKVVNL